MQAVRTAWIIEAIFTQGSFYPIALRFLLEYRDLDENRPLQFQDIVYFVWSSFATILPLSNSNSPCKAASTPLIYGLKNDSLFFRHPFNQGADFVFLV
jgi:hypothetical protein